MVNNDEMNNVLFIGIGGAGASLASQLHSKIGADSSIVLVNTDEAALQQSATVRRLLIGQGCAAGSRRIRQVVAAVLRKNRIHNFKRCWTVRHWW